MKETILIDGEEQEIEIKPITLLYDGSYGAIKIEPPKDKFVIVDCNELVTKYHELDDNAVDFWVTQPMFLYMWTVMWGENIAKQTHHSVVHCLPETAEEFNDQSSNVKHVFAMLASLLNAQAIAVTSDRTVYLKYPELGLHPGVQANIATVITLLTHGGFPQYVLEASDPNKPTPNFKGKRGVKTIMTHNKLNEES